MATSATFNAAFAGAVGALSSGRASMPSGLAAEIKTSATAFATQVETNLTSTPITLPGQATLLSNLVTSLYSGRYSSSTTVMQAWANAVTTAYTLVTAIVP